MVFPIQFSGKIGAWEISAKSLILLVGAPRFELGTPSPPDFVACPNFVLLRNRLGGRWFCVRDFFRDFLNSLQGRRYFVGKNVRILNRGLDIGVAECMLD